MQLQQPRRNLKTIGDLAYVRFIDGLVDVRKEVNLSQADLADKMGVHQSFVAKVETRQRRLDLLEYVRWMAALEVDPMPPVKKLADSIKPRRRRAYLAPDAF